MWVGGFEVDKVLEFLDWGRLHGEESETSLTLHLEALNGRRSQTIGSQVLANLSWVRRVKVTAPIYVLAEGRPHGARSSVRCAQLARGHIWSGSGRHGVGCYRGQGTECSNTKRCPEIGRGKSAF
jgi:hypothetical protein